MRATWTHIVPGKFGGSAHTDLFFYDATRGESENYRTDGAGGMTLLRRHTNLRKTWQFIAPGQFSGNSITDLLFYDPTGSATMQGRTSSPTSSCRDNSAAPRTVTSCS